MINLEHLILFIIVAIVNGVPKVTRHITCSITFFFICPTKFLPYSSSNFDAVGCCRRRAAPCRIGASVARRGDGGDGGAVRVAAAALATRRSRRSVKNDELKALEDGQGITFTRKKRFNNGEKCNALQQPPLTHTLIVLFWENCR